MKKIFLKNTFTKVFKWSPLVIIFMICTGVLSASAQEKSWQLVLAEKTPLEKEEIQQLFPKELGGFPLVSFKDDPGMNAIIGTYCHKEEPDNETTYISLTITDGAGFHYFQHINEANFIVESGYSEKNETEWARIEKVNGQNMIFRDVSKGDRFTSGIVFVKGLRYLIAINGVYLSTDDLRAIAILFQELEFPE